MNCMRATPGDWVDTNTPISEEVARKLKMCGIVGVFRYVSLPGVRDYYDISRDELQRLTGEGLQVGLVQHPRYPNWVPQNHPGAADARVAAAHALDVGYPQGAHIFCDWEGPMASTSVDDATSFLHSWGAAMILAGFAAGLYVGYNTILDEAQLYELPSFDCYWSDAANRHVAVRGCAVRQGSKAVIAGVNFDLDTLTPDLLGGHPMVCGV